MWAGIVGLRGTCAPLQALRGGHGVALLPGHARALQTSVASCGSKNLLKKFASKTRKKFWYEGPSLGPHLTHKPSKYEFLMKSTAKKARREDSIRLKALNGLLYKALTELLCTPEVSQELYDLNVELSKVSVTSDFSACRAYWKIGVSADQNRHTEAVLQRSAAYMRHLLMSQQTLRNVPPIVFVQDKKDVVLAEVDRLLSVADFGPPDERDGSAQDGSRNPNVLSPHDSPEPTTHPNLCGIDHEELNKQIMEYKRKKEKGLLSVRLAPPPGRGLLPELPCLPRKRKAPSRRYQDTSPKSFLLGEEDEDEDEGSTTDYDCQTHEAEEEWQTEAGDNRGQQGLSGQREQG
ncbi:putative ribosome-binding factor A, mitochondrial [Acomys russatus]|uniref:putative ribosome-binding factor A, mitochondrial n=1 Tax=Acomys russatus TaxID=60746 RepID=UPI0021E2D1EC|nr:putative ribosome-binding factor A, mitochondrial [Acomys russatus]